MKLDKTDDIVDNVRDWAVDKIEAAEPVGDKFALYAEFEEWIEIEEEGDLEIVSMEGTNIDKWTNPEK